MIANHRHQYDLELYGAGIQINTDGTILEGRNAYLNPELGDPANNCY